MSSQALTASLVLKLQDQLTGPLRKLTDLFDRLRRIGDKVGLRGLQNATDMLARTQAAAGGVARQISAIGHAANVSGAAVARLASHVARLAAAPLLAGARSISGAAGRIGAIGAIGAGAGVIEPLRNYAALENTLRHIAITEKKTGPAVETEVARLAAMLNQEGLREGLKPEQLANAYRFLITTGMPAAEVDRLMPIHARAAVAYNIDPDAMGQAVFALADTFKIGHEQMGGALASMALASKESHFGVEDLSRFLPTVSASMGSFGMRGRGAADTAFAALETVRKSTGDSETAAHDFKDLLDYLAAPIANRSFKHAGIDLPKLLLNAEKQGVDPLTAILGKMSQMTAGMTPVAMKEYLGKLFHNMQARDAIVALLQHQQEYLELKKKLGDASEDSMATDHETAMRAPQKALDRFLVQLDLLTQRVGKGFEPMLVAVNARLDQLGMWIDRVDHKFPGLIDGVLLGVGGFLALAAVLGVIGFVGPSVMAALALLVDPLVLLAGAAFYVWQNWEKLKPFFVEMWEGIKDIFWGSIQSLLHILSGDLLGAYHDIEKVWGGLGKVFDGAWQIAKTAFNDFIAWLDSWTGGLGTRMLEGIKAGWQSLVTGLQGLLADLGKMWDESALGKLSVIIGRQFTAPSDTGGPSNPDQFALPPAAQVGGEITVRADPGTSVTGVTSNNARVPIVVPDRGDMTGRD